MSVAAYSLNYYRRELTGKQCRRVDKSDEVLKLVAEMAKVCLRFRGVGLAAPQIGVYIQLAIAITAPKKIEILINPEIVNLAGRDLLEVEGCLSFPPYDQATAKIWRSEIAHVKSGTEEEPEAGKVTIYRGYPARIVQHEIDHLKGIFFIDHCGPVSKGIVLRRLETHLRHQRQTREEAAKWPSARIQI